MFTWLFCLLRRWARTWSALLWSIVHRAPANHSTDEQALLTSQQHGALRASNNLPDKSSLETPQAEDQSRPAAAVNGSITYVGETTPSPIEAVVAKSQKQQQPLWPRDVYVMRHGERQDTADARWLDTTTRPWDPPLSAFGHQQAAARGRELRDDGIQPAAVIVSPFTRCIQTACGVMRALGTPPECMHVHASVCEWLSLRNLNAADGLNGQLQFTKSMQHWFWGEGVDGGAAIRAVAAGTWSEEAAKKINIASLQFPGIGETHEAAHNRFQQAVYERSSEREGTVLIITHGDAVGAIVEHSQPGAVVYEVQTTGYVHLRQPQADAAMRLLDGTSVQWLGSE